MSEVGRESRGKQVDTTCPICGNVFKMPAEIILDGGDATCPNCNTDFRSDGSAGKELDAVIDRFRRNMKNMRF